MQEVAEPREYVPLGQVPQEVDPLREDWREDWSEMDERGGNLEGGGGGRREE